MKRELTGAILWMQIHNRHSLIHEHQQDQSEECTIQKGINRCNSLDAEAQQAQSNTCIGNESMTKEYSSTANINVEGKLSFELVFSIGMVQEWYSNCTGMRKVLCIL